MPLLLGSSALVGQVPLFEFSYRHRAEGLCVLQRQLVRVSSRLRNETGGPGSVLDDTFILARQQGEWVVFGRWPLGTMHWQVTDGDLARPREAQTQGLLTVSFPSSISVPAQSLCLVTVYRTVSGRLQESVTICFWGHTLGLWVLQTVNRARILQRMFSCMVTWLSGVGQCGSWLSESLWKR